MTLTDQTLAAHRSAHDQLVALVRDLPADDLSRQSGAAEWTVAQVLSHLGSSAELALPTLRAAQAGRDNPADGNQAVWDRWNAWSPEEQRAAFLEHSETALAAYEALDAGERESLRIPLGFLPEPATVGLLGGMRLNEAALHGWDVAVAFDEDARLPEDVSAALLDQHRGPLSFLLGFTGKTDQVDGTPSLLIITTAPDTTLGLHLGEQAALGDAPDRPDGELRIPAEALLRLISGRLPRTPAGVASSGGPDIDDLRRVFPGY